MTFAERVYRVVAGIPAGRVSTYGDVAAAAGVPGGARAVGQALKRNPYAPAVPCHRVIASDLRIGGFQGCRGGEAERRKLSLLAAEGVHFAGGKLRDAARIFHFRREAGQGTDGRRT